MNASEVLHLVRDSGLTVTADGERLIVAPADRLNEEARQMIRDNKPAILAGLEAEAAELARLVYLCGNAYQFSPDEHREALQIALADPSDALTCFRAMAAKHLEPGAAPRAAKVRVLHAPSPNLRT